MGRFYKATPAQFIDDKMFELDSNAMMHAVKTIDGNIDKVYEGLDEQAELLKSKRMEEDDPAVRERLKAYEDEITGISTSMNDNILGYRKHGATTRTLSRKISSDLADGLLGTAEKNLAQFEKSSAELEKRTDVAKETKNLYNEYSKKIYGESGGAINTETGAYQTYDEYDASKGAIGTKDALKKTLTAVKDVDLLTKIDPRTGEPVRGASWVDPNNSNITHTTTTTQTEITEKRIRDVAEAYLDESNFLEGKTQEHKMERKLGHIENTYRDDGSLITDEDLAQTEYDEIVDAAITSRVGERGHKQGTTKSTGGGIGSKNDKNTESFSQVKNNFGSHTDFIVLEEANAAKDKLLLQYGINTKTILDSVNSSKKGDVTWKQGFDAMKKAGIFNDAVKYNSWLEENSKSQTKYEPTEKELYITFNKRDQNQSFVKMVQRNSNNEISPILNGVSEGKILETTEYIYTPVTSTSDGGYDYKRIGGFLVGEDNDPLFDKDGNKLTDPAKAVKASRLVTVPVKTTSTETRDVVSKASYGELKSIEETTFDAKGKPTINRYYVLVKQVYKINKTGLQDKEVLTLETWYHQSDFPKAEVKN